MMNDIYDVLVVGAGPAGLTAALYAGRAGKSVIVFEKEVFGGQITYSPKVENYPGIPEVSGNEFAETLLSQISALGVSVRFGSVSSIRIADGDGVHDKIVTVSGKEYSARTVIIASGSRHRPLGVEREEELVGAGVSYCAVCDGAFFAGARCLRCGRRKYRASGRDIPQREIVEGLSHTSARAVPRRRGARR